MISFSQVDFRVEMGHGKPVERLGCETQAAKRFAGEKRDHMIEKLFWEPAFDGVRHDDVCWERTKRDSKLCYISQVVSADASRGCASLVATCPASGPPSSDVTRIIDISILPRNEMFLNLVFGND